MPSFYRSVHVFGFDCIPSVTSHQPDKVMLALYKTELLVHIIELL